MTYRKPPTDSDYRKTTTRERVRAWVEQHQVALAAVAAALSCPAVTVLPYLVGQSISEDWAWDTGAPASLVETMKWAVGAFVGAVASICAISLFWIAATVFDHVKSWAGDVGSRGKPIWSEQLDRPAMIALLVQHTEGITHKEICRLVDEMRGE